MARRPHDEGMGPSGKHTCNGRRADLREQWCGLVDAEALLTAKKKNPLPADIGGDGVHIFQKKLISEKQISLQKSHHKIRINS